MQLSMLRMKSSHAQNSVHHQQATTRLAFFMGSLDAISCQPLHIGCTALQDENKCKDQSNQFVN